MRVFLYENDVDVVVSRHIFSAYFSLFKITINRLIDSKGMAKKFKYFVMTCNDFPLMNLKKQNNASETIVLLRFARV